MFCEFDLHILTCSARAWVRTLATQEAGSDSEPSVWSLHVDTVSACCSLTRLSSSVSRKDASKVDAERAELEVVVDEEPLRIFIDIDKEQGRQFTTFGGTAVKLDQM